MTQIDHGPWTVIARPSTDLHEGQGEEIVPGWIVCLYNGDIERPMSRIPTTRKFAEQPRKKFETVLNEETASAQTAADTANELWEKSKSILAEYRKQHATDIGDLAAEAEAAVRRAEDLAVGKLEGLTELEEAIAAARAGLDSMLERARAYQNGSAEDEAVAEVREEYAEATKATEDVSLR